MNRGVNKEHIDAVLAIDDRVLRNYWVTQTYADISDALRSLLDPNTANWCTYATWASRTVGSNMRGEALPKWLHDRVLLPDGLMGLTQNLNADAKFSEFRKVLGDLKPEHLMDVTRELLGEMAINLSDGNTEVFAEITPPAAIFIAEFSSGADPHEARAKVLAACQGVPEYQGVNRLAAGYSLYCDAMHETDPKLRSQLILAGSLQLGTHEQNHLQPVIVSSMDMGVNTAATRLKEKLEKELGALARVQQDFDKLLQPALHWIGDTWGDIMTFTLGTLQSPEGTMHLDHDVPLPKDRPYVTPDLEPVKVGALGELLAMFNRAKKNGKGSFARDWANLMDRMNFISNLFISRHHVPDMFDPPFDAATLAAIEADRTPAPSGDGQ